MEKKGKITPGQASALADTRYDEMVEAIVHFNKLTLREMDHFMIYAARKIEIEKRKIEREEHGKKDKA